MRALPPAFVCRGPRTGPQASIGTILAVATARRHYAAVLDTPLAEAPCLQALCIGTALSNERIYQSAPMPNYAMSRGGCRTAVRSIY